MGKPRESAPLLRGRRLDRLPFTERRKRLFVTVGGFLGTLGILFFCLRDYLMGETSELWFHLLNSGGILGATIALHFYRRGTLLYRLLVVLTFLAMASSFLFFSHEPPEILWFFPFPIVVFYVLGTQEGLYWVGGVGLFLLVLLFWPELMHSFSYPTPVRYYYCLSFGTVSIIFHYIERLREEYQRALERRLHSLEEARAQILQLKGLIPICERCKSVRDDKGYWTKLESYLEAESGVAFSHGICDRCIAREYPEIYEQMRSTGKLQSRPRGESGENRPPRSTVS